MGLAVVGLALAPAVAAGSTAAVATVADPFGSAGYAELQIQGQGTERNVVTITSTAGNRTLNGVADQGAALTGALGQGPHLGCLVVPLLNAGVCVGESADDWVAVDLGAGNDTLDARALAAAHARTAYDLGSGDDRVLGGPADETITPGSGANYVSGGGGSDTVYVFGVAGVEDVRVTLDGVADDGPDGHSNILPDVENVLTGWGSDVVIGSAAGNVLDGGEAHAAAPVGSDHLEGRGGNDKLSLGRGVADGGDGDDTLEGGRGSGSLIGGLGHDRILAHGTFSVDAGPGDDVIDSSNHGVGPIQANDVVCGPGFDTVKANAIDTVAADCEQVTRVN
jgi:Ca2+-binding RTX toxin-like protein